VDDLASERFEAGSWVAAPTKDEAVSELASEPFGMGSWVAAPTKEAQ